MLTLDQVVKIQEAEKAFRKLEKDLKEIMPVESLRCGALAQECGIKLAIHRRGLE